MKDYTGTFNLVEEADKLTEQLWQESVQREILAQEQHNWNEAMGFYDDILYDDWGCRD
jgi:hypothetical protein